MNPEFQHFDGPNEPDHDVNSDPEAVPEEAPTKRAQVGKSFLKAVVLTGALLQFGDSGGAANMGGGLTAEELQPKKRAEQYKGDELKTYTPTEFLHGCEASPIEFIKYFPQFHGKPEVARQAIDILLRERPDALIYGVRWLGPYKHRIYFLMRQVV